MISLVVGGMRARLRWTGEKRRVFRREKTEAPKRI